MLLLRPVDASGDILPVLSSSVLVSGSLAVTQLVRDRLNLLTGEWWENPAWGCEVFEMGVRLWFVTSATRTSSFPSLGSLMLRMR